MSSSSLFDIENEGQAARAFSKQSLVFDEYDESNTIIRYKRQRVRTHVLQWLAPGSRILELNAGTGIDAAWFARQGFQVHATDLAEGMQQKLGEKVIALGLENKVTKEICSFNDLDYLQQRGPYDCIFSNFAGLNCTDRLDKVLESFDSLLKPGGQISLAILPGFCLWEFLLIFKGKFKTAFRRLFSSKGARSHVEGHYFRCWYYSPAYVTKHLGDGYELLGLEGLCTIVPPSYIEGFAEKYPRTYTQLRKMEDKWKGSWPWRSIGDYYIISFRKKG